MISFDGVKVGDRVRLTRTVKMDDGEEFEASAVFVAAGCYGTQIDVAAGCYGTQIDSDTNTFLDSQWDTVEVLSPPKPPLPTEDGVYAPRAANLAGGPLLFTRYQGDWRSSVGGAYSENLARIHMEKSGLVRLVPEGEPSGLLEAARAALVTMKATGSGYGCAASRLSDAIEKAEAQS